MIVDDGTLQRVPTVLLDLTAQAGHSQHDCTSIPGLVQAYPGSASATVAWSSLQSTASFPREIVLRVLSSAHYVVRGIHVVFKRAKRPSRVEVLAAFNRPSRRVSTLDHASQCRSAVFEPVCDAVAWPPESSILVSKSSTTAVPISFHHDRLATDGCMFVKLILHRPHAHLDNPDGEIAIKEIDLVGTFQLPSRHIYDYVDPIEPTDGTHPRFHSTGLSDHHGSEVLTLSSSVATACGPVLEPTLSSIQTLPSASSSGPHLLDSLFDCAMREYVGLKAAQDQFFARLRDSPRVVDDAQLIQNFSLPHDQPQRLEAIATYTFGAFFSQCLLQLDAVDVAGQAVRTAERLSPLLPQAGLSLELVYEGLVAVISLSIRSRHEEVFHDALHLLRTIYQQRSSGYELLSTLTTGRIYSGLQCLVDELLSNDLCWSGKAKHATSSTVKSIDRQLLLTLRLLLSQQQTRDPFLRLLCDPPTRRANDQSSLHHREINVANRLRVMRWLLQRHEDKLDSQHRLGITAYCGVSADSGKETARLASECLALLHNSTRSTKHDLAAQLELVKRLVRVSHEGLPVSHMPLFDAFPISETQHDAYVMQLRKYYELHARPLALYQQTFTMTAMQGHAGEFRKGNIVFKGQVEARQVPTSTLHSDIRRQTLPFEFTTPTDGKPTVVTLEASFASFRGTVEERHESHLPRSIDQPKSVSTTRTPSVQSPPATTPTPHRRPSRSNSNRVVPVDHVEPSAPVNPSTLTASTSPTPPAPLLQRPSTVALTSATPSTQSTAAPTAEPVSPTPPQAQPKTAPAGSTKSPTKARASQDGCSIQ